MCLSLILTHFAQLSFSLCRNPGEDTKMLVCDMCDKGYHTFCLQPAMESLPTNGWRCKVGKITYNAGWLIFMIWIQVILAGILFEVPNCWIWCPDCFHQGNPWSKITTQNSHSVWTVKFSVKIQGMNLCSGKEWNVCHPPEYDFGGLYSSFWGLTNDSHQLIF